MYKKILLLTILSVCSFAHAQTLTNTKKTEKALAVAEKNTTIDQNKYAHPDDFLYEEKTEENQPELEEVSIEKQTEPVSEPQVQEENTLSNDNLEGSL